MKSSVKIIFLVIGIALLYIGVTYLGKNNTGKETALEVLDKGEFGSAKYRVSLIKLAKQNSAQAQRAAKKILQDTNAANRITGMDAMGHFEDDVALAPIKTSLEDGDHYVRHAAIRALSKKKSQERYEIAKNELDKKTNSNFDIIELHTTLSRIGGEADLNKAIKWLVDFAKKGNGSEQIEATRRAAMLSPNGATVVSLLRKKLSEESDIPTVTLAVRHLSAIQDSFMKKNLDKYIEHENIKVRRAAVNSIPQLCPENKWDLLNNVLEKEMDSQILTDLVNVPKRLSKENAVNFLEIVIKTRPAYVKQAQANKQFILNNKDNPVCEN